MEIGGTQPSALPSSSAADSSSLLPHGNIITVPIIAGDATVASADSGTAIINVPIMRDATFLKTLPTSQSFVITAGPDGSSTVFLDPSQFVVAENSQPPPVGEFVPLENAVLGQSGHEPGNNIEPNTKVDSSLQKTSAAEVKPPTGKSPYRCETCAKVFPKWTQLKRHIKGHADDKPFRCNECDFSFNIESNLVLHKATHNRSCSVCPQCGKMFSRNASFKAHLMLHEKEEYLICHECGDEFHTQAQLDRHIKRHNEPVVHKVYNCKFCRQGFARATLYHDHMKTHYRIRALLSHRTYKRNIDRSQFNHKCKNCHKLFQKPSQLERHMRIHTGERPYVCEKCNKSFNQKGALQIHLTRHSGVRPHRCAFCPAAFSQRGNLRAHIQRVHAIVSNANQPVYSCDQCSCSFRKLGSLNAHMSRMHAEEGVAEDETLKDGSNTDTADGQAVRDVVKHLVVMSQQPEEVDADSTTNNKSNDLVMGGDDSSQNINSDILQQALQNSGLTSTEQNSSAALLKRRGLAKGVRVSNSVPGSSLATYADSVTGVLKRHVIKKVGGVRWHQCLYCVKEFKKPSDLVRHIRIHTHEKPYKCPQCFRSFTVKSTLTAHIRTHSGLKEFSCTQCLKLFSTQGSLKVHLRLHTGARPFVCSNCGKRFRTSGHRKSHMLSHAKEVRGAAESEPKRPRRPAVRRAPVQPQYNSAGPALPDIPLQEPILITESGLVQAAPKNNRTTTVFGELFTDGSVGLDRPYKCPYCARGFKKSSHLKQHVRSHTGEKPYQCQQCFRNFVSGGVLKAHMRTHSGIKGFRCAVCGGSFTTNGSLKRHMSTHSEVRPFMCPYCQKTFKTSVNCKKHMKVHKQELALQAMAAQTTTDSNSLVDSVLNSTRFCEAGAIIGNVAVTDTLSQFQPVFADQNPLTSVVDFCPKTLHVQAFDSHTFEQFAINGVGTTFAMQPDQLANTLDITGLDQTLESSTSAVSMLPTTADASTGVNLDDDFVDEDNEGSDALVATNRHHRCTYCDRTYDKPSNLKQHMRSHTGERPFQCPQCDRMFVSSGVLKSHLRTHSGTKDFKCYVCQAEFTTNGSLTRHMMIHENVQPFKCMYCDETFRASVHWKRHMKSHGDDCTEQLEASNRKSTRAQVIQFTDELTDTIAKQVPDDNYSLSEKILIASAAEKDRVSEIRTDLNNAPRHRHRCNQCFKSFKKPSDLVRHLRIHTGEKPFQCAICQKSFTVKSTLDSHLKTHSGEKHFACHVCDSLFATKGSLKVHMRLHTGSKPFKCLAVGCEMRFRTSGHRKSHMATHLKMAASSSANRRRRPVQASPNHTATVCDSDAGDHLKLDEVPSSIVQPQPLQHVDQILFNPSGNLGNLAVPNITLSLDGLAIDESHLLSDTFQFQLGRGQTIQIDASILQQLQQGGNFNITINPNFVGAIDGDDSGCISVGTQTTEAESVLQPMTLPSDLSLDATDADVSAAFQLPLSIPDDMCLGAADPCCKEVNLNMTDSLVQTDAEDENGLQSLEQQEQEVGGENRAYSCKLCSKTFKRAAHLREHLKTHEPRGRTGSAKPTPHGCKVCGKRFAKPSQLERHLRIHTGERPFVCTVCNRAFNQKNSLQIHMNKHTGQKPFPCPYCGQAFAQKGNVRVHIRRVHAKDTNSTIMETSTVASSSCAAAVDSVSEDDDEDDETSYW